MQWQFFCSHFKAEEKCLFPMIKQQLNLTNQNSEFISSIIQYEENPELTNVVYKVFISNSIFFLVNKFNNCTEPFSCLAKY